MFQCRKDKGGCANIKFGCANIKFGWQTLLFARQTRDLLPPAIKEPQSWQVYFCHHHHFAFVNFVLPWSHLRYNFKILPEHQLQNLEQTLKPYPQSPNKNLTLWPKLIFQICTKLLSTCFSSSTSTTVTTPISLELPSSHTRVTLIKFTKQEWVSESVS